MNKARHDLQQNDGGRPGKDGHLQTTNRTGVQIVLTAVTAGIVRHNLSKPIGPLRKHAFSR